MGSLNMRRILATVLGAMITLVGCQKSSDSAGSAESASISRLACKAVEGVDASSLNIVGNSSVQVGSLANYKLDQDLSCTPDQKVAWKTVSPGSSFKDGNSLTTSFSKAGEYVVTAEVQSAGASEPIQISTKTTVVGSAVTLSGPQYGMVRMPVTFSLALPTGVTVASAQWSFGDAGSAQSSVGPLNHTYVASGTYVVRVNVVDSTGASVVLSQNITIIPLLDGYECLTQLAISGPTEASVNQPVALSAFLPTCIGSRVGSLTWSFGDGATDGNQNTTHTYTTAGTYHVSLAINVLGAPTNPMFTLTRDIVVSAVEAPAPNPTPNPTPDPLSCSVQGQTRTTMGDLYTEEVACGVNGKKTNSYRDQVIETCQLKQGGEFLAWSETSRSKQLQSEGQCQGQSCELPASAMTGVGGIAQGVTVVGGKYYLAHGGHLNFYSSQTPEAACSTVQQSRSCDNGVLSGSSSYAFLLCTNGCAGFGADGTVKTGVITGELTVAKTCSFGETGFNDIFYQISDQKCDAGQIVTSNPRQGSIKTAASCPVYSYAPTDTYSTCSADCGGVQNRQFECRDNAGNVVASNRCAGEAPVETRVCDGNPDAVKRSEAETSTDEDGSSNSCPANQIGVIVKSRAKTVTTNFACIDHSVQQASQDTTYGEWVTDNYCRDYVGYRCNQDSLNNKQAAGRYDWMVKCADEVPVIKEFLTKFDDIKEADRTGKGSFGLGDKGRVLYPTFMDRNGKNSKGVTCEKAWIAPTDPKAPCNVPSTVYVAAVCVSSCATPEQQIMAQASAPDKLKYATFLEAWKNNFAFVATLQSQSTMSSKRVQKTKVDQWVTELVDSDHVILEFRMKSGGQLRLTTNHPLLGADAIMKPASDFKAGEKLVRLGGVVDEIVSITSSNYYGKVYNLFVKSADLHQNIVVTNGYLNGTAMYQNEGAKFMNTAVFRNNLLKGVFGK